MGAVVPPGAGAVSTVEGAAWAPAAGACAGTAAARIYPYQTKMLIGFQ